MKSFENVDLTYDDGLSQFSVRMKIRLKHRNLVLFSVQLFSYLITYSETHWWGSERDLRTTNSLQLFIYQIFIFYFILFLSFAFSSISFNQPSEEWVIKTLKMHHVSYTSHRSHPQWRPSIVFWDSSSYSEGCFTIREILFCHSSHSWATPARFI